MRINYGVRGLIVLFVGCDPLWEIIGHWRRGREYTDLFAIDTIVEFCFGQFVALIDEEIAIDGYSRRRTLTAVRLDRLPPASAA